MTFIYKKSSEYSDNFLVRLFVCVNVSPLFVYPYKCICHVVNLVEFTWIKFGICFVSWLTREKSRDSVLIIRLITDINIPTTTHLPTRKSPRLLVQWQGWKLTVAQSPTASKISAGRSNITSRSSSWRMKFIHHSQVSTANGVSRTALNSVSVLLKCQTETWNLLIYSVRPAHSYFY